MIPSSSHLGTSDIFESIHGRGETSLELAAFVCRNRACAQQMLAPCATAQNKLSNIYRAALVTIAIRNPTNKKQA